MFTSNINHKKYQVSWVTYTSQFLIYCYDLGLCVTNPYLLFYRDILNIKLVAVFRYWENYSSTFGRYHLYLTPAYSENIGPFVLTSDSLPLWGAILLESSFVNNSKRTEHRKSIKHEICYSKSLLSLMKLYVSLDVQSLNRLRICHRLINE